MVGGLQACMSTLDTLQSAPACESVYDSNASSLAMHSECLCCVQAFSSKPL